MRFDIVTPMPASLREAAATLYLEAFGQKLGRVLGHGARPRAYLAGAIRPDHALAALSADGDLLGMAGFQTAEGRLIGGGFGTLARHYGLAGAFWRAPLLALLERRVESGILQMDGICVAGTARGRGVGTALLRAIFAEAGRRGLAAVRLDVIDTNPRAAALYRREGFEAERVIRLGPLKRLFGFSAATRMLRRL